MMRYVAGVDGGGTKTIVVLTQTDGTPISRTRLGALNYNGQPQERTRSTLEGIIDILKAAPGGMEACAYLCVATAGLANPAARAFIHSGLEELGYRGRLQLAGDERAALYGAMGQGEGIVLIAGTGSICYGQNAAGQNARSGGWGYIIDDPGSGYALGREVLSSVMQAHDGRIPPTCLTDLVLEQLGVAQPEEIIGYVYAPQTGKGGIAAMAPLLDRGLEAGDKQCLLIAEAAARSLARMVAAVAEKLKLQAPEVALCGSVQKKDSLMTGLVQQQILRLLPGAQLMRPRFDAAQGAAQMALESAASLMA